MTNPADTAALDQWRASATETLDTLVNNWRDARESPACDVGTELGGLACFLRESDHDVVADLLAIAIGRFGAEPEVRP
jgi:hypothetical protein